MAVLPDDLLLPALTAALHVASLADRVPVATDPLGFGVSFAALRSPAPATALRHTVLAESLVVRLIPLVLREFVPGVSAVALGTGEAFVSDI